MRRTFFLAAALLTAGAPAVASAATAQSNLAITVTSVPGGDPTAGLLPSDRDAYANWKMAGLQSVGGIPDRTTSCATVNPIGRGSDDSTNIQTAVNGCPSGEVVTLTCGTFTIAEGKFVHITTSITVRGCGPCAGQSGVGPVPYPASPSMTNCTLIQRTGGATIGAQGGTSPSAHFILGTTDQYANLSLGTATNLAVDGAQGSTTVQVASTSGFSAGQIVLLDEASNLGWQTSWTWPTETQWSPPDYRINWRAQNPTCQPGDKACSGGSTAPSIPCYFNFNSTDCDRYTNEIKQIASIGAGPCPGTSCTITFNSPLIVSYRAAQTAHVAPLYGGAGGTTPPATYVGLESMTLQNADGSSVIMGACAYCWLKNTEDTVYFGYFSNGSIAIEGGFRDQLEGVYTHTSAWPYPGGAGYNWSLDRGSSEILIENSISMLADKVMVAREGGAGSVIAYSYFDECILGGGSGLTEVGINASHWMGSHHVLFEGNWTYGTDSDPVWGSTPYMTFMRNYVSGFRTPFYDYADAININDETSTPGTGGPYNGAHGNGTAFGSYWYSYIANVIGTPGAMTSWVFESPTNPNAIWYVGHLDSADTSSDPEVWSQQASASECVSSSGDQCPLIRLGNYDYVTNSINDPGSPSSFPDSFYLLAKPAFFSAGSGYTWPWVTSTGSPQVQSGPTTSGCTANVGGACSGLPAKARFDNGTPFAQP
jgi:hypothetical protein